MTFIVMKFHKIRAIQRLGCSSENSTQSTTTKELLAELAEGLGNSIDKSLTFNSEKEMAFSIWHFAVIGRFLKLPITF